MVRNAATKSDFCNLTISWDRQTNSRGGQSGGAGGAQATPGILIFQKQVTLFTKSGDTLELE